MTSKLLAAFLFLALVVLVVEAQKNETATNVIDECIKRENCAVDDRECRAACAGVPDPDPKVAVDTQECYKKCADEHLPDDENAYKSCTGECRVDVYQEGITEPGSSAPSKSQTNNGDGQESSGDGKSDNTSSEGDDDGDDESGEKEGDSKDDDSGASLVSKSALVYVFAAVLACAAFTGL